MTSLAAMPWCRRRPPSRPAPATCPPMALLERFISADCAACWTDTTVPRPARAVVLDWIVPGRRATMPLSAAATRRRPGWALGRAARPGRRLLAVEGPAVRACAWPMACRSPTTSAPPSRSSPHWRPLDGLAGIGGNHSGPAPKAPVERNRCGETCSAGALWKSVQSYPPEQNPFCLDGTRPMMIPEGHQRRPAARGGLAGGRRPPAAYRSWRNPDGVMTAICHAGRIKHRAQAF